MWQAIMERMPSTQILIHAALSALIPWSIYKINQKLHQYGDPPWKKKLE